MNVWCEHAVELGGPDVMTIRNDHMTFDMPLSRLSRS